MAIDDSPVVEISGARLAFGDRVLWDHLDLVVRAGEFLAVLGPNGTGKTSLLQVLLGAAAHLVPYFDLDLTVTRAVPSQVWNDEQAGR